MAELNFQTSDPCCFLRSVPQKVCRWIYFRYLYLCWQVYRVRNRSCLRRITVRADKNGAQEERATQENIIRTILAQKKAQSFLEIGIGAFPNIPRLEFMAAQETRYTGCDFWSVCERHRKVITEQGCFDPERMRFFPNRVGTYSWNLFEALKKKEQFDLIYLDGHHTFYVDLPALVLAHALLKPGGYLLVDDIPWTLQFLKKQLLNIFDDWVFYRKIYDFSDYTEDQQKLPHIQMMVETVLMGEFKYQKAHEYSTDGWWTLRKPGV